MNFHEFCVFQKPASMKAELQKAFSNLRRLLSMKEYCHIMCHVLKAELCYCQNLEPSAEEEDTLAFLNLNIIDFF
jgi:hypothetical protein